MKADCRREKWAFLPFKECGGSPLPKRESQQASTHGDAYEDAAEIAGLQREEDQKIPKLARFLNEVSTAELASLPTVGKATARELLKNRPALGYATLKDAINSKSRIDTAPLSAGLEVTRALLRR